jgi:type VI protein secretion system component VasA
MSEAMAKADFCLGCVPIINLFSTESKSMVFEQEVLERPLEPALALNKDEVEIYKVKSCQVWAKGGKDYITQPMYQSAFTSPSNMPTVYWQASQQPCWQLGAPDLPGTETLIQIKMPAEMAQQHYLYASLLCTNRDAVLSASFCQQADELVMTDAKDQKFSTHLLYQPSAPVREEQTNNLYQVLGIIASAQQQMFSLENDPGQVERIKKALHALNRSGHEEVTQLIDQLVAVECSRITKRHSVSHQLVYVSGLEVKITMPIEPSQQGLFYLFGQALNVWSQHYCPVNSFVSITIVNQQTGKSMSWPTKFH